MKSPPPAPLPFDANDAAFRLRRVIVAISEKQTSQTRSSLDAWLRFVSPSTRERLSEYPVTVRPHPVAGLLRCRVEGSRPTLLIQLVGSALVALVRQDAAVFDCLISWLEEIARLGLDKFHVAGDDMHGYSLQVNYAPTLLPSSEVPDWH